MDLENPENSDKELETQLILLASTHHDLEALRTLLRKGSANVQDPDTGFTPLHSAIAACESSSPPSPTRTNGTSSSPPLTNGHTNNGETNGSIPMPGGGDKIAAAAKTMKLLLQNGAIWNDLDKSNETPGCLALRLGFSKLYAIMVDAGIRAEMLLNRLDEYEILQDEDDEGEDEEKLEGPMESEQAERDEATETIKTTGDVPIEDRHADYGLDMTNTDVSSEDFLSSGLTFSPGRLLDQDKNGVMMAWETDIMQQTADLIAPTTGLRILNIGHGMGIIDNIFQTKLPSSHHIIEAHPAIIAEMKKNGWYEKPDVVLHEGKWQEVVPKLIEEGILFDAIYFDTFAEDYKALREFFSEYVIGLLDEYGRWGFFNGLGADRQICYDVCKAVCEMDLFEAGYDVEWQTLKVPDLEKTEEWKGVRRSYFALNEYKLPVCTFVG